jgi:hypothetical protein
MTKVFDFIKAARFFPKYAPQVKNYKHKLRGTDGNNKPIEFTAQDRKSIRSGIKSLIRDIPKKNKDLA